MALNPLLTVLILELWTKMG